MVKPCFLVFKDALHSFSSKYYLLPTHFFGQCDDCRHPICQKSQKKKKEKKKKRRKEKKEKGEKKAKNSLVHVVVKNNAGPNVKQKKIFY